MKLRVVRKDEWTPDHSPMKGMNAVGIVTLVSEDVWFELPVSTKAMLSELKMGKEYEMTLQPV